MTGPSPIEPAYQTYAMRQPSRMFREPLRGRLFLHAQIRVPDDAGCPQPALCIVIACQPWGIKYRAGIRPEGGGGFPQQAPPDQFADHVMAWLR